jgi:hypothetical protein
MLRSFGGALQWECVTPGRQWQFSEWTKPEWGTWNLWCWDGLPDRSGWYLSQPGGLEVHVGRTLAQAAAAAEEIILNSRPRRPGR